MINPPRLAHYSDPDLGTLAWDERDMAWVGQTTIAGRPAKLALDTGLTNPTREEQMAQIEPAKPQLAKVQRTEPQLRSQAIALIIRDVELHEGTHCSAQDFDAALELSSVDLHKTGELHYRMSEAFVGAPGWIMTIFLNEDMTIDHAETYELHPTWK